jgi:hypothetical protein
MLKLKEDSFSSTGWAANISGSIAPCKILPPKADGPVYLGSRKDNVRKRCLRTIRAARAMRSLTNAARSL